MVRAAFTVHPGREMRTRVAMRAIWKGAITFGLVNIPVSLYPATRREELKFRLLRGKDLSPVNFKRVAEADGKEVPWGEIVKGYEYEKGKFVILKDEDFARVDIEATQTVDILHFVAIEEVNPLLFYKPYYMEAAKGGDRAYVLLRDALSETGKIAISKVVIKTRQHLAAVKPQGSGLMLELMHFPHEILNTDEFKAPQEKKPAKAEITMARQLIASMTEKWKPDDYTDEYRDALEKMIEDKVEHGGQQSAAPAARSSKPTNVIDLVSVLQQSIEKTQGAAKPKIAKKTKTAPRRPAAKSAPRKKAA